MRDWWSASSIAQEFLPGVPSSPRTVQHLAIRENWAGRKSPDGQPLARKREGRGGGWEYHVSLLPLVARRELEMREIRAALAEPETRPTPGDGAEWAAFARKPAGVRQEAERRMRALMEFERLTEDGGSADYAAAILAHQQHITRGTIYAWRRLVRDLPRSEWLPALAPAWKGRTVTAACSPEAWEAFKADYLRLEKPSAQSCYDRLVGVAADKDWVVPSIQSLMRRIERELPAVMVLYLRQGQKALRRTFAAQKRSRTDMHALQGVNVDGHTLDAWMTWPDGEVSRPILTVIQDLYSGKILAWRMDKSENATVVRLVFHDLFRDWGIPQFALLDNGRAFASKAITGGQPTRFRFKVEPGEALGLLSTLGVKVHWATPYSGQSKPIERAFRDLCDRVAKHPALAGAYAGNRPEAKPDYAKGVRPASFEAVLATLTSGIAEHNAREGRRSDVAAGRSLDAAFEESYTTAPVQRATAEQLRLALLAAEQVTARKPDGSLHLAGNRYWSEWLSSRIGERLTLRYDPDDLHAGVAVYDAAGEYLGEAECWQPVGHRSTEDARQHAKRRHEYVRHVRKAAELAVGIAPEELAALHAPTAAPAPAPEARVVRMVRTRGANALKPDPLDEPSGMSTAEVIRLANAALDRRDPDERAP